MSSRQSKPVGPTSISKLQRDNADIVIIGNGIAGLTAAVEARRLAPDKQIVIITDQIHPTINTPALKQFAIAKLTREQLLAYPAGTERTNRIHVVTARVQEIHARSKYVTLNGGYGFGYDNLLIATGSAPQGLPADLPGREFDGVMTLHRLQDYLDLRRRIGEIAEAVVIGGGAHAIETVMGLQHWGIHVHWLIRGSTFMRNVLDTSASELVLNHIKRNGVAIHTETEVMGIVGRIGSVVGVITNTQEMITCQLVLSCTGTRPVTTLAEHCSAPMQHKQGIIVDDKLRSSVRDVYAAGDVAALRNPQTGKFEPRAQWYAAVYQGRIAGAMLAGQSDEAKQPFGANWHATHLGDLSMLTVGDPLSKDSRVTTLADNSQGSYHRVTLQDNRLLGYLSLGAAQPDSLAIKRIIDEGHNVRDILKSLLKGNFDSRRYLSQLNSRAAEKIITTRKLPEPDGAMLNWTARRQATEGLPQLPRSYLASNTSNSQPYSNSGFSTVDDDALNVFSGNLPELTSADGQSTGEMAVNFLNRPDEDDPFAEEPNPFTGTLPELHKQRPGRTQNAQQTRYIDAEEPVRNGRNLWSFTRRSG